MKNSRSRILIRNLAIEVAIYSLLVVGYFFLVLRLLAEPLEKLFTDNLTWYAFVALGLIVIQGAALELITSFLVNRLNMGDFTREIVTRAQRPVLVVSPR